MSRESMIKIKETEERAEAIIAEARERAREMLARAEADGKVLCETTERETAAELSAKMDRVRERTAQNAEQSGVRCAEETEELKKSVSLRRKMAEKIVVRGFEKRCR